jgi:hypothetical protein
MMHFDNCSWGWWRKERAWRHQSTLAEELAEISSKPAHTELLYALKREILSTTKKFELKWGHGDDEVINWKILADDKHINEDPLGITNSVEYVSAARNTELSELIQILMTYSLCNSFHQLLDMLCDYWWVPCGSSIPFSQHSKEWQDLIWWLRSWRPRLESETGIYSDDWSSIGNW